MGAEVLNAVVTGATALVHFCGNHTAAILILLYFAAMKSPERIPLSPQAWWTWGRDTAQAIAETKTLPRPTQPALTVPEKSQTSQ